ncbi:MAG: BREX system P-loop protein BrxC, partial [Candidatus Hydrogenedentes bacterium]|nr:BREX system P-loop protein BrxC [Candidatus Hydrogenedentota bacterium]
QRDPAAHGLVNQGPARIVDARNERAMDELRGELSTFVCEGQYADGIQRIIRSYLDDLTRTSQKGAWVSGFFGSGKSHVLKMLCHLWQDTVFPDGATARSLVPVMPDDLKALLRELDTAGKRAGGLLAAAGALPSGTTENVRLTILGILLQAIGLPAQYPQAQFCLWLHAQGYYKRVKAEVEAAGKTFESELNNLYVSPFLAKAVIACDANFASSEAEARKTLRAQFPPQSTDISTEEFLRVAKAALMLAGRDGRMPCTVLVLDEVQQFIGDSTDRSVLVTEVAEAVSKQLDSHVMVVAAGQSALTDQVLLQKMLDRFTIRVPLSDAEVETVTRKVLLQKKPSALTDVRKVLDDHAGEVSRQLQGTRIAERTEDHKVIVEDYPLLPVRRRFWEQCFRQIDAAGTHSQLRSQLRIIHDAVAKMSDKPLGSVVPADELYEALAPEMINTGVLLREINERIILLGETEGKLARRVCGLVFLIGKVRREDAADIGVRASKEHIADLLVEDLTADNGKLRAEVEHILDKLTADGALLNVGDEYRLQTREGSEWDQEFRNRQTKLRNDAASIQFKHDQLLYAELDKAVRSVKLLQGDAKEARMLAVHRDQTPPPGDGQTIPVWIRDGWSAKEKEHVDAARTAGADSPTIFVFVPRQSADDLRRLIVEAAAAQETLDAKGNPSTDEGQEARQGMESRRARAVIERDRLIQAVVANAKVFQGGGNEVFSVELVDKLRDAADASLVRLFPRFKEADSKAWASVIKRARDGAEHPFQPTGHTDATEKHPVCQQVLAAIGSGSIGSDIRKQLRCSPYGWPQDAVDAALIALHRAQHINAVLNGTPVPPGQLDQNKISKAEFRVEQATLSVQDRLVLRKLYQLAGIACKSGEEAAKASEFLKQLIRLAADAGGEPPLPPITGLAELEDLERLVGNEQLVAIKDKHAHLEQRIKDWTALRNLAEQRLPSWRLTVALTSHAISVEGAKPVLDQLEAFLLQRLLLDSTDHLAPIRKQLAELLRAEVNRLFTTNAKAYEQGIASLNSSATWTQLPESERDSILSDVGLIAPIQPTVGTDEDLSKDLMSSILPARRAAIDAIPGRVSQALQRAAKLVEPQVQTVRVDRITLRTEEDVDGWCKKQKHRIIEALTKGPVLID